MILGLLSQGARKLHARVIYVVPCAQGTTDQDIWLQMHTIDSHEELDRL